MVKQPLLPWANVFGKPDMERIGLFAEMPFMNGKGYVSPFAKPKSSKLKGLVTPGHKILSANQDSLFDREFKRVYVGECLSSRGRKPKPPGKNVSDMPFISIVGSKLHSTPGDYHGTFGGAIDHFSPITKPRPKYQKPLINFLTRNGRKGGPGYIDITINKYPTYMPSKYGQKAKYKSYGENVSKSPLILVHRPRPFFDPNPYKEPEDSTPGRIYVKPKEKPVKVISPGYIIPVGPGKEPGGMHAGTFSKFPEFKPEKYLSVHDRLKPKLEPNVFYPQSMGTKSYYNTSVLNQNVDFRINLDNHMTFEPSYIKHLIK